MTEWLVQGIGVLDDGTYDVAVRAGDKQRRYVFATESVHVAGEVVLLITSMDFETDTIASRGAAKTVLEAVRAFHQARQSALILTGNEDGR